MARLLTSSALLLATLLGQAAAAGLGGQLSHHFATMADMGLLPDGTPMSYLTKELKVSGGPPPPNDTEVIEPEYVEIPLDHFGHSNEGTYHNRYWVAQSGYKKGGPVFIYDVGEGDAEPSALFRLQDKTSFFKQIVDQYGGIGVVWEHRFYGNSTPVEITLDTPAEAFRFLNTEQSLADVKTFADQFSRDDLPDVDLTPKGTPWVFVGGSYPGMRAAFMRQHYPETIYASYASSAPVEARVDMSVYFDPVYRGLKKYGFGNCTNDVHNAILHIDELLEDPRKAAALKLRFLGRGADKNSNPTFGDALSTIFWLWQSYGVEGGASGLRSFCNWIESDPKTNKTAPAEGWAKSKGVDFVLSRWASWPAWPQTVSSNLNTTCEGPVKGNGTAPDCNLDLRFSSPDSISWTWQYCTQWGFFQSANLGDQQIVSKWNSLVHQKDICHRQFPDGKAPLFPAWPNTNKTNRVFGGWDIRPSNTYWSGGEFDPWRTLSPLSGESWAPHPVQSQDTPQCSVSSNSTKSIFGYVMANAQHCYDFRTTFAGGSVSRKYFTNALTEWLKCWKPRNHY